jgi:hypothetical protein
VALAECGPEKAATSPAIQGSRCPAATASASIATAAATAPTSVSDVYLPPERASGARFCLDPDSASLRADVQRQSFQEDERLDAAGLAEDIRDLHAIMARSYAGYPVLLQSPSFDVEAFFDAWQKDVRAAGPSLLFGRGVLQPLVTLRHQIRDNHLSVWGWGGKLLARADLAFSEYQAAGRVEGLDATSCEFSGALPVDGTVRVSPVLTQRGLEDLSTFSAQSTVPSVDVRCGGRTVRFDRRAPSHRRVDDAAPVYEWHAQSDATVIVVRRLYGSPQDKQLLAQLAADYEKHRSRPVVVFDFRGNGGGDDGYVYRWVDQAKRGRWLSPYQEHQVAGGHTPCGEWNALVVDQIRYDHVDDPAARQERADLRKKLDAERGRVIGDTRLSDAFDEAHGKNPYGGRIFALVDAGSASSGESAPEVLRAALGATIVGERSAGFLEFGNLRPYVMPRTGVFWQLASKQNFYPSPHDGVGLAVDVYLPSELLEADAQDLVARLEKIPRPAPLLTRR